MPENLPYAMTTTYGVQIVHTRSEGIVANPVAGPPPQNASLVRLHAPFELISVYWSAISEGAPPVLPSSESYLQNYNRVLIGGERVGVCTPARVGHYWCAAGRFDYVVVGPEGLDSAFALGKCPWEGSAVTDFYIPAENFRTGIVNPNWLQPLGLIPDPDVLLLNLQLGIEGPPSPPLQNPPGQ